jgi:hypothetical protein
LYNSGAGEIINKYPDDSPTIYKTAGDADTVYSFDNFSVVEGTVDGTLGYQLSEDGITWEYWNGAAWVVAGAANYNSAATVDANIPTFSPASNAIYVKTFLVSDGLQTVEIDEIQVTYTSNANPDIDAGTNKTTKDNTTIKPFSDCTFSDPDGTVDHAYYKVDGEVDIWTEIPQGAFGTLLEAVQDFDYTYNNLGDLTTRLKVEDNLGGENEDFLVVTVEKYTKTVNVKDILTGDDIINFAFNPGDGSGTAQQDSPFEWDWAYGSFDVTIEKDFFYVKQETIFVEDETELNIFLQASSFLNECVASVGLMTEGDRLSITAWLQQGGEVIDNPTSCTVELYDQNDDVKFTDTSSNPEVDGHFQFNKSPSELENEGVYHLEVTIIAGGCSYRCR